MSPTAINLCRADPLTPSAADVRWEGCTRGRVGRVGGWVVREGYYTGTQAQPSQGPYSVIFKPQGPTYGQMKLFLRFLMRFLR